MGGNEDAKEDLKRNLEKFIKKHAKKKGTTASRLFRGLASGHPQVYMRKKRQHDSQKELQKRLVAEGIISASYLSRGKRDKAADTERASTQNVMHQAQKHPVDVSTPDAGSKSGPSVHRLKGHLNTTTTVVDHGTDYKPVAADVGDLGPYYDVADNGIAMLNDSIARIEEFFDEQADTLLVNSEHFAELGDQSHYYSVQADATPRIGVVVAKLSTIKEKHRYEVINPLVSGLTIVGKQLTSLAGTGMLAAAPAPDGIAGGVRELQDIVDVLADAREKTEKMREGAGPKSDGAIYAVTFHATGFGVEPDAAVEFERLTFRCKRIKPNGDAVVYGLRFKDLKSDIVGALRAL